MSIGDLFIRGFLFLCLFLLLWLNFEVWLRPGKVIELMREGSQDEPSLRRELYISRFVLTALDIMVIVIFNSFMQSMLAP